MKLRNLLVASAVAVGGAVLADASPVGAAKAAPRHDCRRWQDGPGPYGWIDVYMSCHNIQAENLKFRMRNRLYRRSDGVTVYRYSEWKDCNFDVTTETWDTDLYVWVASTNVVDNDNLAGGC